MLSRGGVPLIKSKGSKVAAMDILAFHFVSEGGTVADHGLAELASASPWPVMADHG